MANPAVYATDLAKVLYTLSKIAGEGFAAEWVNMKAEFVEDLKWAFDDLNDQAMALADLTGLKQGAMTAPEYFAKFATLIR